jgi:hypothetical protein
MATFLPGQTDQFGPLQLHTPDYSFLMQAYGAKQAQYDRGFNTVKNLYNSVLNSPVSSAENEEFRKNAFDKIQDALKSVSGVDLSDPNTVRKAMGIMDPISSDKELAYDMAVTKYHQQQKSLMEQYKNSTDPKKRAMYNEQAERYIQLAEEDMRSARRGTGEITRIQPKDFVVFEDVMGFLNEAATKQGLKIEKTVAPGDGYIYKLTNGKDVIPDFNNWAKVQMGNRFDRQFAVQGEVQAQTSIRNIARTQGVSTERAREIFAQQVYEPMVEKMATQGEEMEKKLFDVEKKLKIFETKYGSQEPTDPDLLELWSNLNSQKEVFNDGLEALRQRTADFQSKGLEYVSRNLEGLFSEEAKNQNALNWASSKAMTTAAQDIKSDQVTISKWQMQNSRDIAMAQITAADRRHMQNLSFNAQKFELEHGLKTRQQEFNEQKFGLDLQYKYDALGAKTDSASGKKGMQSMEWSGFFTPIEDGLSGAALVQEALTVNDSQLFSAAFDSDKGLMGLVIPEHMDHGKYYGSIMKLRQFAQTGENKLTEEDKTVLRDYAKEVGSKTYEINGRQSAALFLDNLALNTFNKGKELSDTYAKMKSSKDLFERAEAYENAMARVSSTFSEREQLAKEMKRLAEVVVGSDGRVKQEYLDAGLKVATRLADGTPVFDMSKMKKEDRAMLEPFIGEEFKKRTNPVGQVYSMKGLSDTEIFSALNPNIMKNAVFTGNKLADLNVANMGPTDFRKLFNDEMTVSFNPVTKEAILDFAVSPVNAAARGLKITQPEKMSVTIPYESLMSSPSLKRLADVAQANTVKGQSAGKAAEFISNKYARVEASEFMKNAGFNYSIFGMDGVNGYGVKIAFNVMNPEGKWETQSAFKPISNPDNPEVWVELNRQIDFMFHKYKTSVEQNQASFKNQQLTK